MAPNPVTQTIAAAALAYATWITYKCPCRKLVSCHLKEFWVSTLIVQFLVANENGYL